MAYKNAYGVMHGILEHQPFLHHRKLHHRQHLQQQVQTLRVFVVDSMT